MLVILRSAHRGQREWWPPSGGGLPQQKQSTHAAFAITARQLAAGCKVLAPYGTPIKTFGYYSLQNQTKPTAALRTDE